MCLKRFEADSEQCKRAQGAGIWRSRTAHLQARLEVQNPRRAFCDQAIRLAEMSAFDNEIGHRHSVL